MKRVSGYRRYTQSITFYATPEFREVVDKMAKGNRSSYIRGVILALNQDKDLRKAVEKKMAEVNYD
jgi:hypothetical protein